MRRILAVTLAFLATLATQGAAAAPPVAGSLDPTFGVGGKTTGAQANMYFSRPAMLPDGRILVTARSMTDDLQVMRHLPDGALDTTFDGDGVAITDVGGFNTGLAVTAMPNGGALAVGVSGPDAALVAYRPGGALDIRFSGDGKRTLDAGGDNDAALAVVLDDAGRILVAGVAGPDIFLARILRTGALDPTFGGGDGITVTDLGGPDDSAHALQVDDYGRILVGGRTGDMMALERYTANGALDTAFGDEGIATLDPGGRSTLFDIGVDVCGHTFAAGSTGAPDIVVARFNGYGIPDPNFSGDGYVTLDTGGSNAALAMEIQPDGRIVTVGYGESDFEVARFEHDGSVDASFGSSGWTRTDFGSSVDSAFGSLLRPDGKVVATGFTDSQWVALARYLPGPWRYQPDVVVADQGKGVYDPTEKVVIHVAPGGTATAPFQAYNQGLDTDVLRMTATSSGGPAKVRYFHEGIDLTYAVVGPGFVWGSQSPGSFLGMTMQVKVPAKATSGKTVLTLRAVSDGYSGMSDTMRFVVKVP